MAGFGPSKRCRNYPIMKRENLGTSVIKEDASMTLFGEASIRQEGHLACLPYISSLLQGTTHDTVTRLLAGHDAHKQRETVKPGVALKCPLQIGIIASILYSIAISSLRAYSA
ncbi:putative RNA-directed DNA polymerase from transposon BS [Fusarium oxysporum f. sp. albedinis]|nr:putative RNA-directed DNA polymerase from transposon BS [Fusarium oxysporum f. sp. albedinis]